VIAPVPAVPPMLIAPELCATVIDVVPVVTALPNVIALLDVLIWLPVMFPVEILPRVATPDTRSAPSMRVLFVITKFSLTYKLPEINRPAEDNNSMPSVLVLYWNTVSELEPTT